MEEQLSPKKATITVEEAAEMLGIGRNQAYEAVRSGRLPHIRFGRRILIPRKALDAMLAQPANH